MPANNLAVPFQKFRRHLAVGARSAARRIVFENRQAETRGLAQANRSRDNSLVNTLAEMLANFVHNLRTQIGPAIKHGHNDSSDLKVWIRARIPHLLDHANDFHEAFESEVFA